MSSHESPALRYAPIWSTAVLGSLAVIVGVTSPPSERFTLADGAGVALVHVESAATIALIHEGVTDAVSAPILDVQVACDPEEPPFYPCCNVGTELPLEYHRPPRRELANDRHYLLWCARTWQTARAAWVCGHRREQCDAATERSEECGECGVYTGGIGKPATWTAMRTGTMFGPFGAGGRAIGRPL